MHKVTDHWPNHWQNPGRWSHTNHSVCLKPVAIRLTMSSHSLAEPACRTTQQKPFDSGVSGQSATQKAKMV
uniref:Uncharacterized protein n=1 Tax=Anguilla anguilla TaxID=7936 RepID=A0A0E9WB37_ANGAN